MIIKLLDSQIKYGQSMFWRAENKAKNKQIKVGTLLQIKNNVFEKAHTQAVVTNIDNLTFIYSDCGIDFIINGKPIFCGTNIYNEILQKLGYKIVKELDKHINNTFDDDGFIDGLLLYSFNFVKK
jgi:hypothetical protein